MEPFVEVEVSTGTMLTSGSWSEDSGGEAATVATAGYLGTLTLVGFGGGAYDWITGASVDGVTRAGAVYLQARSIGLSAPQGPTRRPERYGVASDVVFEVSFNMMYGVEVSPEPAVEARRFAANLTLETDTGEPALVTTITVDLDA